jgi:hypothetical protein
LELGDTTVGQLEKKRKNEFKQVAGKLTDKEWAEMESVLNSNSNKAGNTSRPWINNTDGDEEEI